MTPLLESLAQSLNYADLPETWRLPDSDRFSAEKTLYEYQTNALQNAARALYLYYGKDHNWASNEPQSVNSERKQDFARLYDDHGIAAIKKYDTLAKERREDENQVFRILSEYINPQGDLISYSNLINRMCFWMATGSGKTLVMVKLIEYLYFLKKHGEIPSHNILILAPSDHLIGQIRHTIDEFNRSGGLQIDLVPLRRTNREPYRSNPGDSIPVYYHRSDNISNVQKDALTDYRTYENGGKWYVFLDEAHKGGKEDSKRQAYYAVMAREGFLFNFSATFTDQKDIVTTVKKYNLEEFIKNGYGKNIYLNEQEYGAFNSRTKEISHNERRKIVLKSLITLGYVSMCANEVRKKPERQELYHLPLMLTLVNSVNTDVENEKNDLWAFFQTLREIATGEIDQSLFTEAKNSLSDEWREAKLLFQGDGSAIIGMDEVSIKKMKVTDLREAVFLSRRKGAVQMVRSADNKELAFQMKNADAPFALIRIGDTSKWRNTLLAGFEETTALKEQSFFAGLETSNITILMGSRAFFESWDSNRPNVINFINIGGLDAKKFVVQSVGRGVRIEPLRNKRRRLACLLPTLSGEEKTALESCRELIDPLETLFLFATNRSAVRSVLEGMRAEKTPMFEQLEGFVKAPRPQVRGAEMPLLVPEYKEAQDSVAVSPFAMSDETHKRLKLYLERTSDSVFTVRDGLTMPQIDELRTAVASSDKIRSRPEKNYAMLSFLQNRLMSHPRMEKVSDSVRELGEDDIVHFRHIRVSPEHVNELKERIQQVKQGKVSDSQIQVLAHKLQIKEITREEYDQMSAGQDKVIFKDLTIKRLLGHYYLPVVTGEETVNYIQHIIKVPSEVDFLNELEAWTNENEVPWDAWMFSKLDEALDQINFPYFDGLNNEYRRFIPDFVFWMCKGDNYQIVFVDPKSTEFTKSLHKLDGFKKLFEENEASRTFNHRSLGVRVRVLMFSDEPDGAPGLYCRYWTDNPGDIFAAA